MVSEAGRLGELLESRDMTLSLAESCTGGMISAHITSYPGASSFFKGSVVTYSNRSKVDVLGVRDGTLEEHGAVSTETAEEMAAGARRLFGSDIAGAVTGIAGPSGGTPDKPVGTVCIAIASRSGTRSMRFRFSGSRDDIRDGAMHALMAELIKEIR